MSSEKDKTFQSRRKPSPRQFAPIETYPRPYVQAQLQMHYSYWKERIREASDASLDLGAHAAWTYGEIADRCQQGYNVLSAQQVQEQGTTLQFTPEQQGAVENGRPYALGAYASSLLMQKLLNNQVVGGSILTKTKANVGMDFPSLTQADLPWAVHIDKKVFDTHFETPKDNPQWYKDQDGLLLIRSTTPAEPTDALRFSMQMDGVPENFGEMVTLYPYVTANGVLEP